MVSWLEDRPVLTDADFLAAILSDGKPHTTSEIIGLSFKERGCGITVHSRAADLRKKGMNIDCRCEGKPGGRAVYSYQLTPFREPQSSVFSGNEPLDEEHGDAGRGGSPNGEQLALVPGYPRERFA